MRVLALAMLVGVCAAPDAFAAESGEACPLEEARPRAAEGAASENGAAEAQAPDSAAAPRRVEPAARRRSVRRIPDAELIGLRGTL